MKKIKIAHADDHLLFTKGVELALQNYDKENIIEYLYAAENGLMLLEKIMTYTLPDIILMDIQMPVMDGFSTTIELKRKYKKIKIIALTMFDYSSILKIDPHLELDGYLSKATDPDTIISAIKIVYEGGVYFSTQARKDYLI